MATYQNGNIRSATANTKTAMRRSAQNRQCPACARKSAMQYVNDGTFSGRVCRWCGHSTVREIGTA